MFSTTLKRSAAILGVVAGLLAAAVPAGAMPIYMQYPPDVVSRPDQTAPRGTQVASESVRAAHASRSEVAMESVARTQDRNDVEAVDLNALGTRSGRWASSSRSTARRALGSSCPTMVRTCRPALKTAGPTRLEAGQRVKFDVTQGPRGPQAEDVRVLGTQIGSEG